MTYFSPRSPSCRRRLVLLLSVVIFLAGKAEAQELHETLSQLGGAYAQEFMKPFGDVAGATLNTGLFHGAHVSQKRYDFSVYVGMRAFGAWISPGEETFDLAYDGQVELDVQLGGEQQRIVVPASFTVSDAPTFFGDEEAAVATVSVRMDTTVNRLGVTVPVLLDTTLTREIVGGVVPTNIVPWFVPHVRLGTVFGTDAIIRWMPDLSVPDVGTIGLTGLGVRHSISQYAPTLPVSVAVQIGWQQATFDDQEESEFIRVSAFAANVAVSHRFGPLGVYGALQTERSTLDVKYETGALGASAPTVISFEQTGAVRGRGVLGLALHLGPLVLNVDYNIGHVNVVTAAMGLSL